MAGNSIKIERGIRASTIMEVVVAMVIIVLVFGTAMIIFTNVSRHSLSVKKLRAQAVLQEILLKANGQRHNGHQSVQIGEFRVEQEIKPFAGEAQLNTLVLTAYDEQQVQVAQIKQVIDNENVQH